MSDSGVDCPDLVSTLPHDEPTRIVWSFWGMYFFVCPACAADYAYVPEPRYDHPVSPIRLARIAVEHEQYVANGGCCEFCGSSGFGGWFKAGAQPFPALDRQQQREALNRLCTGSGKVQTMPDNKVYILWQDQCEYYFVCATCYHEQKSLQWSGSTRSPDPDWRQKAEVNRQWHEQHGGACEFCGDKGNGGWGMNGQYPAAVRRDLRLKGQDHA